MRKYIIPSTEVQKMQSAFTMQSTSTHTGQGDDQELGQAPKRRPF